MKLNYFLPAFIWAMIILVISLIPGGKIPSFPLLQLKFADKFIHFSMYFVFALLFSLGFYLQKTIALSKSLYYSFFVSFILAGLTEILQHFAIRGRKGDFFDMAANLIGIIAGLWLANYINSKPRVLNFFGIFYPKTQ